MMTEQPRFAEVAVNAGQPAARPFPYGVPDGMEVAGGARVFVPVGPRLLQGIVLGMSDRSELESVRPISAVADPEPVLDEAHIALGSWLRATYLAPLWDCVATFRPSGYGQKSVTMVSPVDVPPLLPVNPRDQKILQYIGAHGRVTLDALREALGSVTLDRLKRLQDAGHLTVAQGLARPAGRPRFERRLGLLRGPEEARGEGEELGGEEH